jgi:hypothetical protein
MWFYHCEETTDSTADADDDGNSPENSLAGCSGLTMSGKPCVFPFVYSGVEYTECTFADFGFMPWCATRTDEATGLVLTWASCKDCSQCARPSWVGDGECDEETNTPECHFDGDDCGSNDLPNGVVGACLFPTYIGDGQCDDETNNADCAWDGGDCCVVDRDTSECTECICKDPVYNDEVVECRNPSWIGDGFCDDETNVPECNWDGGDCCFPESDFTECDACECHGAVHDNGYQNGLDEHGCHPSWIGDGQCDDETNTLECQFDGGDCCGDAVDARFCTECACLPIGVDATSTTNSAGATNDGDDNGNGDDGKEETGSMGGITAVVVVLLLAGGAFFVYKKRSGGGYQRMGQGYSDEDDAHQRKEQFARMASSTPVVKRHSTPTDNEDQGVELRVLNNDPAERLHELEVVLPSFLPS